MLRDMHKVGLFDQNGHSGTIDIEECLLKVLKEEKEFKNPL